MEQFLQILTIFFCGNKTSSQSSDMIQPGWALCWRRQCDGLLWGVVLICVCRASFSLSGPWEMPVYRTIHLTSGPGQLVAMWYHYLQSHLPSVHTMSNFQSGGEEASDFFHASENIISVFFSFFLSPFLSLSPIPSSLLAGLLSERWLLLIKELIFSPLSLISIANLKHCEFFKFSFPVIKKRKRENRGYLIV